jgi:hypothetical protein
MQYTQENLVIGFHLSAVQLTVLRDDLITMIMQMNVYRNCGTDLTDAEKSVKHELWDIKQNSSGSDPYSKKF